MVKQQNESVLEEKATPSFPCGIKNDWTKRRFCCFARHMPKITVKRPWLLFCFWAAALLWDGTGLVKISLFCAICHEMGHVAAFLRLFWHLPDLKLSMAGVQLSLRGKALGNGQELLLAAAGPTMNFLLAAGAWFVMQLPGKMSYALCWFAAVNLLLGGANLLPLHGLDGWHIWQACWAARPIWPKADGVNCISKKNRLQ